MTDARVDLVTAAYKVVTLPTKLPHPVSAMMIVLILPVLMFFLESKDLFMYDVVYSQLLCGKYFHTDLTVCELYI